MAKSTKKIKSLRRKRTRVYRGGDGLSNELNKLNNDYLKPIIVKLIKEKPTFLSMFSPKKNKLDFLNQKLIAVLLLLLVNDKLNPDAHGRFSAQLEIEINKLINEINKLNTGQDKLRSSDINRNTILQNHLTLLISDAIKLHPTITNTNKNLENYEKLLFHLFKLLNENNNNQLPPIDTLIQQMKEDDEQPIHKQIIEYIDEKYQNMNSLKQSINTRNSLSNTESFTQRRRTIISNLETQQKEQYYKIMEQKKEQARIKLEELKRIREEKINGMKWTPMEGMTIEESLQLYKDSNGNIYKNVNLLDEDTKRKLNDFKKINRDFILDEEVENIDREIFDLEQFINKGVVYNSLFNVRPIEGTENIPRRDILSELKKETKMKKLTKEIKDLKSQLIPNDDEIEYSQQNGEIIGQIIKKNNLLEGYRQKLEEEIENLKSQLKGYTYEQFVNHNITNEEEEQQFMRTNKKLLTSIFLKKSFLNYLGDDFYEKFIPSLTGKH